MHLKQLKVGCFLVLALGLSACGDGGGGGVTITSVQGKVTQGPVNGALIFADRLTGGIPSVLDGTEVSTHTGADGKFDLSVPGGYGDYVLVSQGGHDTLSTDPNSVALQMFAPAGSANVTPLTTLVALVPAAQQAALIAKIEATGVKFDADISVNATPAALLLSKSVESAITTMVQAFTGTGTSLSTAQINDIQQKMMSAIAVSAVSQPNLLSPATLTSAISSGVTNSLTSLATDGITVSNPASLTTAITNTITAVATSISASGNFSTTTIVTEANQFPPSVQDTIDAAITTNADTAATVVTVHPTVVLTSLSLTDIAITSPVKVVFSRAMNAATITTTTFKVAGVAGVTGAVSYNAATKTATFTPAANLSYDTTYTVTLTSGITDIDGTTLVPATLTFKTVVRPLTGSTGSGGTGANF
jgi:hypothetical protein